jgi:hypothetical protein
MGMIVPSVLAVLKTQVPFSAGDDTAYRTWVAMEAKKEIEEEKRKHKEGKRRWQERQGGPLPKKDRKEKKVPSAAQGGPAPMVDYSCRPKDSIRVAYDSQVTHSSWAATAAGRKALTVQVGKGHRVVVPPRSVASRGTSSKEGTISPKVQPRGPRHISLEGVYPGDQAGLPGFREYRPVNMADENDDMRYQTLMGSILPRTYCSPWERPMSYEVRRQGANPELKYSERSFVGVDTEENFQPPRVVGSVEEQRPPPLGYVPREEREMVMNELTFSDPRGVEISHKALQELNSLSWDIEAVKHHVDGELRRRTVGEYQARERYLSRQLATSVAQVAQLREEGTAMRAQVAHLKEQSATRMVGLEKWRKDAEDLTEALGEQRRVQPKASGQHSRLSAGAQQGDVKTSLEYLSLLKEKEMVEKTLEMVTSSAVELKAEVRELKEEKKASRDELKAEKEEWRERERAWRSREAQWNTGTSHHS